MNSLEILKKHIVENNQLGIGSILPTLINQEGFDSFLAKLDDILNLSSKPNHEYVLRLYPHMDLPLQSLMIDRIRMRDMKSDYFLYFSMNNEDDKISVKNSLALHSFMAYQFYTGNVKAINDIQKLFDNKFLSDKFNIYAACNNDAGSITIMDIKDNDHKLFSPYYNFILRPDHQVENCLASENILLPSIKEAHSINNLIKGYLSDYEKQLMEHTIKKYETFILYKDLDKELPSTNNKRKTIKI